MRKENKRIVKFLEANGFTYVSTNSKQYERFTHPTLGEEGISPSISEHTVAQLIRKIEKSLGIETAMDKKKRDVAQVKTRQAADREKAAAATERLNDERAEISERISAMDARQFGGLIVEGSAADIAALRRRLIEIEDERRFYEQLMTDVPSVNAHSGRSGANHRA